jgi:hypothetical protein
MNIFSAVACTVATEHFLKKIFILAKKIAMGKVDFWRNSLP